METGIKGKDGDVNTGCDAVKRIVKILADAGCSSIYGLIDCDGENQPSQRIAVLEVDRRDGLENIVFDPLLVAALLARDVHDYLALTL